MLIQYYLADGQEIRYQTGHDWFSIEDIDNLAMIYAEMRPYDLPTDVFMHVSLYSELVRTMGTKNLNVSSNSTGYTIVQIMTGCGPLAVHPMPWAFNDFKVLVGKREDYDRYDIDKVFEEVVLKDCEKE